ncbi:hypothetical protein BEWA_018840 [Theileria equi strain WA]|uniref:Uncharacterized protein n=1 Tax=Theileria equi strain WA TaxID=1537102 RepID=L0AVX0_THEEQ|nr:hypothetical protein BEWA_018840 [Theileria equi strain WA]AFZ79039.1 hypothetical protein BEWA_018840 [Theileria equi strain WA]|eukprot:XP_004828705.1 hypothetical protein BEWA_018840 [Theileria equi strain WA]
MLGSNVDGPKYNFSEGVGATQIDLQLDAPSKESGTIYHDNQDVGYSSIASIETQPTLRYNSGLHHSHSIDYSYDLDKISTSYNPLFSGSYSFENAEQYTAAPIDSAQPDFPPTSEQQDVAENAPEEKVEGEENSSEGCVDVKDTNPSVDTTNFNNPVYGPDGLVKQTNKVIAVNPVILVDKVERSLIVQWYENDIKREQRISYKKYGNAKAQQRAEGLISKLLAGSTFDQLYPEKGPPILTIFENAGKYMVSLTRDRIMREWRVDWTNGNGSKMRARWSCKKVGNEEAKKRAETFAYSLVQGTFNPRLLHKATGTRLSKNDMKYNGMIKNMESVSKLQQSVTLSEGHDKVSENAWQSTVPSKRRSKKRSIRTDTETKRTRRRKKSVVPQVNDGSQYNSQCYPYMNVCHDGNFTQQYYQFYPEDCETSSSMNPQCDVINYNSQQMLQQSWVDWNGNNMRKMVGYGREWDYNSNPVDFQYFSQSSQNALSQNSINSGDWLSQSYMNMYMQQGDISTSCDYADNTANDARMPNQYYAYYNDQGICYPDNLSSQEPLGMMNHYYNYSNIKTDGISQWSDGDIQNADKSYIARDCDVISNDTVRLSTDGMLRSNVKLDGILKGENVVDVKSEKDMCNICPQQMQPTYGGITGNQVDGMVNPLDIRGQNLSISTRMYTTDHYGYTNSELGDVKHDEPSMNCFTGEIMHDDVPLLHRGTQNLTSNIVNNHIINGGYQPLLGNMMGTVPGTKDLLHMYHKDKLHMENFDNTYRDTNDSINYYNM